MNSWPEFRQRLVDEHASDHIVVGRQAVSLEPAERASKRMGESPVEASQLLDEYVRSFGFVGIGSDWVEIIRPEAKTLLVKVLCFNPAFQAKMMAAKTADKYAEQFLGFFATRARFFTNGNFHTSSQTFRWKKVAGSQFDTGVVCLDDTQIGLAWVDGDDQETAAE